MSPRPNADDLHVAPPRVRADDAFVARLAAVSAAATARERRRTDRGSVLRVAFAAASVAAVLAGGTFTAGELVGADPAGRRDAPPAGQPYERASARVEDPDGANDATGNATRAAGYDDGDGRADREDDLQGVPARAHASTPDGQTGRPAGVGTGTGRDAVRDESAAPPADDARGDDDAAGPPPRDPAPEPPSPPPHSDGPGTGAGNHPGDGSDDGDVGRDDGGRRREPVASDQDRGFDGDQQSGWFDARRPDTERHETARHESGRHESGRHESGRYQSRWYDRRHDHRHDGRAARYAQTRGTGLIDFRGVRTPD
jgi:hypothetical protein